jgi:diguanylate cyclase (GGDEF)-like protein
MEIVKPASQPISTLTPGRLVYLVTHDKPFANYLTEQLNHFGYSIQHVRDVLSLANIIADHHPVAILVDIPYIDHQILDETIFTQISNLNHSSQSILFISEQDNQAVRLKSIQTGGAAFFIKPMNIVNLIDKLDSLERTLSNPRSSRVLIVEGQDPIASYYQMILNMAGLETQIASKPDVILEKLREFHPDLILMDTFMSEINTMEMAKVIRQIDDFVSIPIIFLSGEDDFKQRVEALDLGADDFLIKPIKASHLKAVVRSRLDRSKILRSYMVRDSLTNLLNHTAFRSVLAQEVNRSKRQNMQLALGMLDIDHFKTVNDTYGHKAGDSVLKGLARLFQQRLRNYDIVGRYGGDELVTLLVNCDEQQSAKILDEIRIHFSEIEFFFDKKPVYITFSCGIATFPKIQSIEDLIDAADQALYQAKARGRNLIQISN